jgi:hypothetical protein
MKSHLRISAWILVTALATPPVAGCLDFTPITSIPREGGGRDSSGSSDSAVENACLDCATKVGDAGGCGAEFAQCDSIPACATTVQCVVDQCFNPNSNIALCLAACEQDGGIRSSVGGPANDAFAAFLGCMSIHCQTVCLQ